MTRQMSSGFEGGLNGYHNGITPMSIACSYLITDESWKVVLEPTGYSRGEGRLTLRKDGSSLIVGFPPIWTLGFDPKAHSYSCEGTWATEGPMGQPNVVAVRLDKQRCRLGETLTFKSARTETIRFSINGSTLATTLSFSVDPDLQPVRLMIGSCN